MYRPSEDTYFMEDILTNYRGKIALEVGIGSGYLTRLLCTNFEFVVGTDIDVNSIMYAKYKTLANISNKLLVCSDLSLPLKCKFDLIISNPPYLPKEFDNLVDTAVYGGKKGIELTIRLLRSIQLQLTERGKIVIMRSTLSDLKKMDDFIEKLFLNNKIIAKKTFFFESLEILELSGVRNGSMI
jgi:release factor glutamine methyltransferase